MLLRIFCYIFILTSFINIVIPRDIFSDNRGRRYNVNICSNFHSPFKEEKRKKFKTVWNRCISTYGAPRMSFVKGHKHSGIDLKGKISEKVYSVGTGQVVDIHLSFPHLTLVLKHYLPDGSIIYSSYKHIEDIMVKIGDKVDENTHLARLFNEDELKRSKFGVTHLHFEIRKSIKDGGTASWTSMTMEELDKYCIDPLKFLKKRLEK